MTYRYWCEERTRRRGAVRNERIGMNMNSEGHKKEEEKLYKSGVIAVLSRKEWRSVVQWRVMKKKKRVRFVWRERVSMSDGRVVNDEGELRNRNGNDNVGNECDTDDRRGDENNDDDHDVDDDVKDGNVDDDADEGDDVQDVGDDDDDDDRYWC